MDNGASSYRRFRDGDESGLVEIIRDYKDGLILYLSSYVGDILVAEELAEDTFVLLGTKMPRDRGKASFRTWLYTIGRNIAVDHLRRNSRKNEISLEELGEMTADEESLEASLIRDERDRIIHRALRRLRPEYGRVLRLIYFEDFSIKEAASAMGKSVHSTETLVYRARKALKEQLGSEGYDDEKL